MTNQPYVLDADILIAAHRNYYAPDLCPGFWDCLEHHIRTGQVIVIDRIEAEILNPEVLVQWVARATDGATASTRSQPVSDAYRQMVDWVKDNPQFQPAALDEFGRGADGWLAAYARVTGAVLVTNEVANPNKRNKVPLPDICAQFGVRCINTYAMLRELGARFDWRQP